MDWSSVRFRINKTLLEPHLWDNFCLWYHCYSSHRYSQSHFFPIGCFLGHIVTCHYFIHSHFIHFFFINADFYMTSFLPHSSSVEVSAWIPRFHGLGLWFIFLCGQVKEEMLFEALTTRKTVTVGERLIVPYKLAEVWLKYLFILLRNVCTNNQVQYIFIF